MQGLSDSETHTLRAAFEAVAADGKVSVKRVGRVLNALPVLEDIDQGTLVQALTALSLPNAKLPGDPLDASRLLWWEVVALAEHLKTEMVEGEGHRYGASLFPLFMPSNHGATSLFRSRHLRVDMEQTRPAQRRSPSPLTKPNSPFTTTYPSTGGLGGQQRWEEGLRDLHHRTHSPERSPGQLIERRRKITYNILGEKQVVEEDVFITQVRRIPCWCAAPSSLMWGHFRLTTAGPPKTGTRASTRSAAKEAGHGPIL